uniref:Uncharacterized protein n=1 Tax=Setaria italica TaxID=4555 RepID=K3Z1I8_SETIT
MSKQVGPWPTCKRMRSHKRQHRVLREGGKVRTN